MKRNINRRDFIKTSSVIIAGFSLLPGFTIPESPIRFGWVTDIHYAEAKMKWNRYYSESINKLKEAIELFNKQSVDFTIETGDFKDQNEPPIEENTIHYLTSVEKEFSNFNGPIYHVLGNHDMDSLSKEQFLANITNTGISKEQSYYFFDQSSRRFVVLDACYTRMGKPYDHHNYSWKDANIPRHQLRWLSNILAGSPYPVYIFTHQLLDGKGDLYINNSNRVRKVLEESNKVQAVFQGHNHEGGVSTINGILYYTQKAMVEGSGEANNSYSIVTIENNGELKIEGYRKAKDYEYLPKQQETYS